jgi:hypothetical protein
MIGHYAQSVQLEATLRFNKNQKVSRKELEISTILMQLSPGLKEKASPL